MRAAERPGRPRAAAGGRACEKRTPGARESTRRLLCGRADRRNPGRENRYFFTAFCTHSVETDFGLTIGEPIPLLRMAWAQMPMARETLKRTV